MQTVVAREPLVGALALSPLGGILMGMLVGVVVGQVIKGVKNIAC